MNEPRRIFLIQTAYIGDVVLSTPLPHALRDVYPTAEIDILLIPETEIVYRYSPYIHKILVFDKRKGLPRKLWSFFRLVHHLRTRRYDLALSVHVSYTSSLIMLLSGARIRIGYPRQRFTTVSVRAPRGFPMHQRSLQLLRALTTRRFDLSTEMHIPQQAVEKVDAYTARMGLDVERLVCLAPGSVWATKRWLPEYFAELIRMLVTAGWQCAVLGGKADFTLCSGIVGASQVSAVNAAGEFDLLGSSELIRRSRLLISNDSGPLHIGDAVYTPVLALMGPTSTPGFLPCREHDRIAAIDLYCRPCGKHGHRKCPEGHWRCMRDLKPEAVFSIALEMLETRQNKK